MIVACIALFVALGGTATAVTYVVSSNSQVAPGTISGHSPPTGNHANIIASSVNGGDISDGSVRARDLAVPANFISAGLPSTPCQSGDHQWRDGTALGYNGPVGYYRDPFGIVHLRGMLVRCGDREPGDYAFQMPPGYRTAQDASHRIYELGMRSDGSAAPVFIEAGNVNIDHSVTGGSVFSLEGITFRCAPSGQNGCP
jgi:hypothetical protein